MIAHGSAATLAALVARTLNPPPVVIDWPQDHKPRKPSGKDRSKVKAARKQRNRK